MPAIQKCSSVSITAESLACLIVLLSSLHSAAQTTDAKYRKAGEAQYRLACAECHDGALLEAPQRAALALFPPERIIQSLESGIMATAGMALTRDEKRQVAFFLTGQKANSVPTSLSSFRCKPTRTAELPLSRAVSWNGWGGEAGNSRHQPDAGGLNKVSVDRLTLKWAFAFPGATRSRAQPVATPEVVFTGSQDGTVYALDRNNGCPIWTFNADGEVRGALYVDTNNQGVPETILFGDFTAHAYALDAQTGKLLWKTQIHDHEAAIVTGSVIAHDGTVVVPVSSLEVLLASRTDYECCTFRGALVALDIQTGEERWRQYTTDLPRPTIMSTAGTQLYGPSGAPIWSSPTIDASRNVVYAGTGENYSSPANDLSDAVLAVSLKSGELIWSAQLTQDDAWNGACSRRAPNCPEEDGPDYDIGAAPILTRDENGREVLLIGQKSGMVYALDPANSGELLWEQRAGSGGTMGGIHYGMSASPEALFVGVSDLPTNNPYNVGPGHPGIHALSLSTGDIIWRRDLKDQCEETAFLCWHGISAAVSTVEDLVFAGGLDGILRAFDTASGDILWETPTLNSFGAPNGVKASGGAIEADGPVLVGGEVFVTSGYDKWNEAPGNVLLVYSIDGQ